MAYDGERGGDARGPCCPKCRLPIKNGEPSTKMQFVSDPDGELGLSGVWHGDCAKPFWDTAAPRFKWFGGF